MVVNRVSKRMSLYFEIKCNVEIRHLIQQITEF
jgi:hypothetical protein